MTNEFNLEEYIKDLSPELQEKARACSSPNELLELAADEDMEIPEDALEMVAGGCGGGHECNHVRHLETWHCGEDPRPIIKGVECNILTKRACSQCGRVQYFVCYYSMHGPGTLPGEYAELSEAEYNNAKSTYKEYIPQPGGGYHGSGAYSLH